MTFQVKHFHSNPALNTSCNFDTKGEAFKEAKTFSSLPGESSGVSKVFQDSKLIAYRDWAERRLHHV